MRQRLPLPPGLAEAAFAPRQRARLDENGVEPDLGHSALLQWGLAEALPTVRRLGAAKPQLE